MVFNLLSRSSRSRRALRPPRPARPRPEVHPPRILPDPLIAVVLRVGEDRGRGLFAEPGCDGETRGPSADDQHIVDREGHILL